MELQPWFEFDDYRTRECYRAMSPPEQQWVDRYRTEGYLTLDDAGVDAGTLDAVVAGLSGRYTHSATGYSSPGRKQDAWRTTPAVSRIATSPTVLEVLRTVYQKPPVPFQTLNFERGTEQRAHSDTIHFNSLPFGFMCGVWVALEDIDASNGPLLYYPGSQRLPVFHMDELGLRSEKSEYQKYEDRIAQILVDRGFQPQRALLKRGQALIWSANIFHGGSKVLNSARTRLSQVTHYYFPGCIYYTPLLSSPEEQRWVLRQVRDIRTGELVPEYEGVQHRRKRDRRPRGWLARIPLLRRLLADGVDPAGRSK